MSDEVSTVSSVRSVERGSTRERAVKWLLLDGNRIVLAGGIVLATSLLVLAAVRLDLVAIGPRSAASSAVSSGLVSGTITLVTVALSINQLILSRVFGSPNDLSDKLEGTRALRERVRTRADASSVPNDPAAFLAVIGVALRDRSARLRSVLDDADWEPPAEVGDYVDGIGAYGGNIESAVETETAIVNVLGVILGTEYARNLTATAHLRNEYEARLAPAADAELEAIDDLLESIAVTRQFFKTLSLQQDFARLSRVVAYSGLAALLASLLLALVYRSSSVTVPRHLLPVVFCVGFAVVVTPLATFLAYVLRAATIAHRTVSVGPFVPPAERSDDG